jgi:hypothetical protein
MNRWHTTTLTLRSSIAAATGSPLANVIRTFTLDPATGGYVFGQVPQQLLLGDTDIMISDDDTGKVS